MPWPIAAAVLASGAGSLQANPLGMNVIRGNVNAAINGSHLNITASQNAVINWQSFNIGANETTTFIQPSSRSVVWNQIADANPSQIWGSLNANGYVVLINQNGFYFGPNSSVTVGGFIAVGGNCAPPAEISATGLWNFQGPPPTASIINYGSLRTTSGGSLFLIANAIENHGKLSAPDGMIGLYAGKEVMISDRPDGRGLSVSVALPEGSINNSGQIIADAGSIALNARVVNQDGLIQANSVRDNHGVIELCASEAVNLGPNSVIRANGDGSGSSDGGQVTVKSAQAFTDDPASRIEVRGGAAGGNGGSLELSASEMPSISGLLDGSAQAGWKAGSLLLDPDYIRLSTTSGNIVNSGAVGVGDSPSTLQINVKNSFKNFSDITLQARYDITFLSGTTWDLAAYTGVTAPGSELTLEAGGNILFQNNSGILAGSGWSVNLSAGVDFNSPTLAPVAGTGGIYLNGGAPNAQGAAPNLNGFIQALDGNIHLTAGREVLVGSGYVRTTGGGSIDVATVNGNISAGSDAATYSYTRSGYAVSSLGLGGIGTANGGSVTVSAGGNGNVSSIAAGIGAYGVNPGDVTVTAGGSVLGNFMIRNGAGVIQAGQTLAGGDVGASGLGVNLGIAGGGSGTPGWNVSAARDIYVNEVYNPNGSLNQLSNPKFPFDYAAASYAILNAGHSVQLLGNNIARTTGNPNRLPIYAPILDITAGSGGIVLGKTIVLYPSALGSLSLATTDGGSLVSSPLASGLPGFNSVIVSDSDSADYRTFDSLHAAVPIHSSNTGAGVHLNISGDVNNVLLNSPEAATVEIGGNANNFVYQGQNLSRNDTTSLHIGGNYFSRSDRTFVTLGSAPDMNVFLDPVLSTDPALGARLSYDPLTGKLGFQGVMSAVYDRTTGALIGGDLYNLLHPTSYVLDPSTGKPRVDGAGNPIIVPASFTTDTAALQQLYAASQDIPSVPDARAGIQIGGPGTLDIAAHNIDLGISSGIRSVGFLNNPALANLEGSGAGIVVKLSGDLEMASSQIASFSGGSINIEALSGKVDVGSQQSFSSDDTPKGIYTGHGGTVSVHAGGDINLDGSRIATYDGGDISVISDHGSIDAGTGGKGFFGVTTSQINPQTGLPELRNDQFFGSGIMTTTRHDSMSEVGDITVLAAGDINVSAGGITQIPFNNLIRNSANVIIGNYDPATRLVTAVPGLWNAAGIAASASVVTVGEVDARGAIVNSQGTIVGYVNGVTVSDASGHVLGTQQTPIIKDTVATVHEILTQLLLEGKVDSSLGGNHTSPAVVKINSDHGDVNASKTGVLAQNLEVKAEEGSINGVFASSGTADVTARDNVTITLVAGGTANVSGESVTGKVAAGGDANVSGSDVTASVISTGGTANSNGSSTTGNAFAGVAAPAAQQTAESADKTVASQQQALNDSDDETK
ncbi:MAG: filamentous hemagglutinin N-terminal domain-containing protein, partial [Verrucomicrobiota bacterium]